MQLECGKYVVLWGGVVCAVNELLESLASPVDPIEGGSKNDYDYVSADPVGSWDPNGTVQITIGACGIFNRTCTWYMSRDVAKWLMLPNVHAFWKGSRKKLVDIMCWAGVGKHIENTLQQFGKKHIAPDHMKQIPPGCNKFMMLPRNSLNNAVANAAKQGKCVTLKFEIKALWNEFVERNNPMEKIIWSTVSYGQSGNKPCKDR